MAMPSCCWHCSSSGICRFIFLFHLIVQLVIGLLSSLPLLLSRTENRRHLGKQNPGQLHQNPDSEGAYKVLYGAFNKTFQRMIRVGDHKLIVYPDAGVALKRLRAENDLLGFQFGGELELRIHLLFLGDVADTI